MTDLSALFDEFHLRARVYPALLTCSPVIENILLLWPANPLIRLAPLVVAVGVLFFLADLVRGAGQALEKDLIREWGGLPAQLSLRLTGSANTVQTTRRREAVERLIGRALPTKQQETRNGTKVEQEYDAAVRELIPRVRGADKDALLHGENIRYNFRRNMLACRPVALMLAVCCALGDVAAIRLAYERTQAVAALGLSLLVLVAWVLVVRRPWVKQAANTYRDRFFEALGTI